MEQSARGRQSKGGPGSAGARSNRNKKGDNPIEGKNRVLASPVRTHDPNEKHIKLPPHAAAASGISSGVERVALDFVDKVLDPNLEE